MAPTPTARPTGATSSPKRNPSSPAASTVAGLLLRSHRGSQANNRVEAPPPPALRASADGGAPTTADVSP